MTSKGSSIDVYKRQVYVFGGGHVSQALVPALTAVDFRCVVLELSLIHI